MHPQIPADLPPFSNLVSFRGLPERLRSKTEPVSSCRFLVEETHFGDTPNNLAISFCFLSPLFKTKRGVRKINQKGVKKDNYIFMPSVMYQIEEKKKFQIINKIINL
ncbi:hypothetical protein BpHYR1_011517 [Brachionus plicatilis]|uniref:Uncharacterized protein n=1 Tax=Brachionus plicatilis TaxID=10195 RepID=A0A3M7QZP1_BRAPC|nr:hypothetical protein BpHYR1_011517 [Brachionus plicatilis]